MNDNRTRKLTLKINDMKTIDDTIRIEISFDYYLHLLNERRDNFPGYIPDCVWDFFLELIQECGAPKNSDPCFVVDNIAINGDFGDFDDYKDEGESDEEFIERSEGDALAIFPDERIIVYSL